MFFFFFNLFIISRSTSVESSETPSVRPSLLYHIDIPKDVGCTRCNETRRVPDSGGEELRDSVGDGGKYTAACQLGQTAAENVCWRVYIRIFAHRKRKRDEGHPMNFPERFLPLLFKRHVRVRRYLFFFFGIPFLSAQTRYVQDAENYRISHRRMTRYWIDSHKFLYKSFLSRPFLAINPPQHSGVSDPENTLSLKRLNKTTPNCYDVVRGLGHLFANFFSSLLNFSDFFLLMMIILLMMMILLMAKTIISVRIYLKGLKVTYMYIYICNVIKVCNRKLLQ